MREDPGTVASAVFTHGFKTLEQIRGNTCVKVLEERGWNLRWSPGVHITTFGRSHPVYLWPLK
jgi:hypothetical protein